MLKGMVEELQIDRVKVTFVGAPPTREVERASGVSEVVLAGTNLSCRACGSYKPSLEALRGHEVLSLTSIPTDTGSGDRVQPPSTVTQDRRDGGEPPGRPW